MASKSYNKWKEENPDYSKKWYQANKERVRENAKKKYHDTVVAKRLEEASALLDEEEWKPIANFENYKINKDGVVLNKFGKALKPGKIPSTGHLHVSLSNNEVKGKHFYIHQLVWNAFNGEIPEGLNVCHVDGNPENNKLDNLCLLTHKENLNKPQTIERFKRSQKLYPRTKNGKKKKIVYQFDLEGNFIKEWEGVKTTEEEGFSSACVSLCCSGKYKQHKGYIWSYSNTLNN
jgi:hypothetical protein